MYTAIQLKVLIVILLFRHQLNPTDAISELLYKNNYRCLRFFYFSLSFCLTKALFFNTAFVLEYFCMVPELYWNVQEEGWQNGHSYSMGRPPFGPHHPPGPGHPGPPGPPGQFHNPQGYPPHPPHPPPLQVTRSINKVEVNVFERKILCAHIFLSVGIKLDSF